MAKRLKTVFNKSTPVCDLWAKQSQPSAAYVYYSGGGRFAPVAKGTPRDRVTAVYFEGRDLFSYGSHYLLGRVLEFNGRKIAAVNYTSYSSTTSGHSRDALIAAENAGLLVMRFEYQKIDINSYRACHATASLSDSDIRAAVVETLEKQSARLYKDLAEISYSTKYGTYSVRSIRENVEIFNKEVSALGLAGMKIDVPHSYFLQALAVAKVSERALNDKNKRKQLLLSFHESTNSKSLTREPGYRERHILHNRAS